MMLSEWYLQACALWPYSERLLFMVVSFLAHEVPFITINLFFYVVYRMRWFEKYRLPRKHQPSWPLIKEALQALFVGHFIAQWFIIYLFYDLLKYQGMVVIGPLPSLATFVWQLILMLAINDTLFYWAHRLLHTPVLYRAIHKRHHRFTATVGIASEFAHPIEVLVANTLPTMAGPFLLGSHAAVTWAFIILRVWETVESHSGYEFPWSVWSLFEWQGGASYHDFHHSHNTGNFGGASSKFWDQLMGTDRTYHEYMARISANPALATDIPVDATDPGRAADETPEMRAKSD